MAFVARDEGLQEQFPVTDSWRSRGLSLLCRESTLCPPHWLPEWLPSLGGNHHRLALPATSNARAQG